MAIYGLLCGINYFDTENELRGCLNDVDDARDLLLRSGAKAKNITMLTDSRTRKDISPTRKNILEQLKKVAGLAKAGDTLIFYYSGHGTYSRDKDDDESDKRDEAICPVDDTTISDDELYGLLRQLPKEVKAFVVMDCCHSASNLDLANGLDKKETKRLDNTQHGYVVEISGCQDKQTSADALMVDKSIPIGYQVNKREFVQDVKDRAVVKQRYRGALTAAFMTVARERGGLQAILDICFSGSKGLMLKLREDLVKFLKANRFSQVPNIAYEGANPNPNPTPKEPILHSFQAGRYHLRQTAARENSKTREYVEATEWRKYGGVKLR